MNHNMPEPMKMYAEKQPVWKKRIIWSASFLFILANLIAFNHAWRFTHFSTGALPKTNPDGLSGWQKAKVLFLGVSNPRPENTAFPATPYETIALQSDKLLKAWYIPSDTGRGTVALFHGYGGEKSSMLDKAAVFRKLGYHTLVVDFRGVGGSEGVQTTIGHDEAADVTAAFEYLRSRGETALYLFGTSLGAAAILKATSERRVSPKGIIIECPFGTMYQTVVNRFRNQGIPPFPMAGLLTFWGGVQNGFWAFDHNPEAYAKGVDCPTLLLWGSADDRVTRGETEAIFNNLSGPKTLRIYEGAGHENYLHRYRNDWTRDVDAFLKGGQSSTAGVK